jgi:hypothetical protein
MRRLAAISDSEWRCHADRLKQESEFVMKNTNATQSDLPKLIVKTRPALAELSLDDLEQALGGGGSGSDVVSGSSRISASFGRSQVTPTP